MFGKLLKRTKSTSSRKPDFKRGLAAFEAEDHAGAVADWLPLAERGDAEAQYRMGQLYARGLGVVRDFGDAAHWFRKAADQGHIEAQFSLALCYANGEGAAQDTALPVRWYKTVAKTNPGAAEANVALL